MIGFDPFDGAAVVVSVATRALRRRLRPVVWVTLEEVALDAAVEDGRMVARTSARQVADRLGVDPGTAANALRVRRTHGLLELEREGRPAGRFGLSVYILAPVAGLTVVPPSATAPCLAYRPPEKPCVVEACGAQPHTGRSHPAKACTARPARAETPLTLAMVTAPQCSGQTALDLGVGPS